MKPFFHLDVFPIGSSVPIRADSSVIVKYRPNHGLECKLLNRNFSSYVCILARGSFFFKIYLDPNFVNLGRLFG